MIHTTRTGRIRFGKVPRFCTLRIPRGSHIMESDFSGIELRLCETFGNFQEVTYMRTADEVARLRRALSGELERLPDRNGFGHSNESVKSELREFIVELDTITSTGTPPLIYSEVGLWFHKKPTDLGVDYGVS